MVDKQLGERALWDRFKSRLLVDDELGFAIDVSRMDLDDALFATHDMAVKKAVDETKKLEAGAITNPDEKRRQVDPKESPALLMALSWLKATESFDLSSCGHDL